MFSQILINRLIGLPFCKSRSNFVRLCHFLIAWEISREKLNEIIDKLFPWKLDSVRFPKGFVLVLINRLIEKICVGCCRFVRKGVVLTIWLTNPHFIYFCIIKLIKFLFQNAVEVGDWFFDFLTGFQFANELPK